MSRNPDEVTLLLHAINDGDNGASDRLLSLVYDELRVLARSKMRHVPSGETLQATALVHEAYLRLVQSPAQSWENRSHFFGAAARAMRNILVERVRRKSTVKHGGDRQRIGYSEDLPIASGVDVDLLALDEALNRLEQTSADGFEVVMLRYFAGLSIDQTAEVLNTSSATVDRRWSMARAWLLREMTRGETRG